MRATRRLTLERETLTELAADELTFAIGADAATTPVGGCATDLASKLVECESNLRPCISHGCTR
ncbi:MAG TPA: hypothetical protein VNQ77_05330 [Frankiaceae bacterium]|nr:hypothetical protein [Frankiaceae bacterium]